MVGLKLKQAVLWTELIFDFSFNYLIRLVSLFVDDWVLLVRDLWTLGLGLRIEM